MLKLVSLCLHLIIHLLIIHEIKCIGEHVFCTSCGVKTNTRLKVLIHYFMIFNFQCIEQIIINSFIRFISKCKYPIHILIYVIRIVYIWLIVIACICMVNNKVFIAFTYQLIHQINYPDVYNSGNVGWLTLHIKMFSFVGHANCLWFCIFYVVKHKKIKQFKRHF